MFEQVRDARVKTLGVDHPSTLVTMNNLAVVYQAAGKFNQAIPLLEQVRDAYEKQRGTDHPDTLLTLQNLAAVCRSAKQFDKAILVFADLLKRREAKFGRQHPDTQLTVAHLGVNYKDAGRLTDAIPLLEEAHRASRKLPNLRWVGSHRFEAYTKASRPAEAAKLLQEFLADARKTLPKDSPQLAGVLAQIGLMLVQIQAHADAEPLQGECLTIRAKTEPEQWTTFNTQSLLGGALLGQKKNADAEPLLLAGYEGMKQREKTIPPQGQVRITEAIERLVQLYEATGKKDEAAKWRKAREARVGKLLANAHEVGQGLELRGQLDKQTPALVYQVKLAAGKTYVIDMVSP